VNKDLFGASDIQSLTNEINHLKVLAANTVIISSTSFITIITADHGDMNHLTDLFYGQARLEERNSAYEAITEQQKSIGAENKELRLQIESLSRINKEEKATLTDHIGSVRTSILSKLALGVMLFSSAKTNVALCGGACAVMRVRSDHSQQGEPARGAAARLCGPAEQAGQAEEAVPRPQGQTGYAHTTDKHDARHTTHRHHRTRIQGAHTTTHTSCGRVQRWWRAKCWRSRRS
jgi:hypothetical protein